MLVTLVLRSIVLPYLRTSSTLVATTAAGAATATGAAPRAVASLSTSTGRSRAVEAALAQERLDDPATRAWEFGGRERSSSLPTPRPPQFVAAPEQLHHPGSRLPPRQAETVTAGDKPTGPAEDDGGGSTTTSKEPPPGSLLPRRRPTPTINEQPETSSRHTVQQPPTTDKHRDVFDKMPTPSPPLRLPPAIDKLMYAKLYRQVAFTILANHEYACNERLVNYVVHRLERQGAGKIAARLRRSIDKQPLDGVNDLHFLQLPTELEFNGPKPQTYWRAPLVPPRLHALTQQLPSQRRTRYYNEEITRHLTVQFATPRNSPMARLGQPYPKFGRVRDVLTYIDDLRRTKRFTPDRVTANIVIKAWLIQLSQTPKWLQDPTSRKQDVRDIFDIVATSIENEEHMDIDRFARSAPGSTDTDDRGAPPGREPRPEEVQPFNPKVDFTRHVMPFVKLIIRSMQRTGDREGMQIVHRWRHEMEERIRLKNEIKTMNRSEEEQLGAQLRRDKQDEDERLAEAHTTAWIKRSKEIAAMRYQPRKDRTESD